MNKLKIVGLILFLFVLPIGIASYNLYFYKFFSPKFQNIQRDVFKETRSYNEGKIQDLAKYRLEYASADAETKEVLKSTIQHMFADYQADDMPYQLKMFLKEMRGY